jgi:hypothetical protein
MSPVFYSEQGRSSGRLSSKCTQFWVQAILTWLTGQGMARQESGAEETWTLTERFRVHAKEIALERAYTFLTDLQRQRSADPASSTVQGEHR